MNVEKHECSLLLVASDGSSILPASTTRQTFCREGLGQAYEPQHPVPSWVLTTVRTLYLAKFAMPARNSASFPMLSAFGIRAFL
jgi:hypothetical protein